MLLVPNIKSKDSDEWSIYSIFNNDFIKPTLLLPSYDRPFSCSSHGWLATLDENLVVTFYKPFAESIESAKIQLPPLFRNPDDQILKATARHCEFYMFKFVTSAVDLTKNPDDLAFVVIFGDSGALAYIRPAKDSTWTSVLGPLFGPFDDVMYHKDRFFALSFTGKLASFDVADSSGTVKLVTNELPSDNRRHCFCFKRYLVESCRGELWQVLRYQGFSDSEQHVTIKFRVFRLSTDDDDDASPTPRWDEIKSLDECVVFFGDNTSVCDLASEFIGCQKNCIYFTHDNDTTGFGVDGPWDLGFYNIESGCLKLGFTIEPTTIAKMTGRSPVWVIPNFRTISVL